MKKKTQLTEVDKFFIENKRGLSTSELAKELCVDESVVTQYLESIPKKKEKTRTESLYGNNGRGSIIATEASSQDGDARIKKTNLNKPSFIHTIK